MVLISLYTAIESTYWAMSCICNHIEVIIAIGVKKLGFPHMNRFHKSPYQHWSAYPLGDFGLLISHEVKRFHAIPFYASIFILRLITSCCGIFIIHLFLNHYLPGCHFITNHVKVMSVDRGMVGVLINWMIFFSAQ